MAGENKMRTLSVGHLPIISAGIHGIPRFCYVFSRTIYVYGIMAVTRRFVDNELLTYLKFYRNNSTSAHIKTVLIRFYTPNEIAAAKTRLLNEFYDLADSAYATGRRGSNVRPQHEAEVDDLIGAMEYLDNKGQLHDVRFVAENLDRIPKYGPEELNVCAVVDRQVTAEANIDVLNDKIVQLEESIKNTVPGHMSQTLSECLDKLDKKFNDALSTMSAHVERTNVALRMFADQVDKIRGPMPRSTSETDYMLNVVLTGIDEDRNPTRWRQKVEDTLAYLADRPVDVADMIRVGGRYREGRKRPVLIKLRSIWDKRILLSAKRKLKNYGPGPVYIHADEPLEVRRKQTMDRLQRKAVSDGKDVSIVDGALVIDNVTVFTLQSGFLNRNNSA